MASLVCLAPAELILRVAVAPGDWHRKFHRKPPGHDYVFHPDPSIFPGVRGEAHYRTNAEGLRATARPSREKAERIVCIGGSTAISPARKGSPRPHRCSFASDRAKGSARRALGARACAPLRRRVSAAASIRRWIGDVPLRGVVPWPIPTS
jgi:hypothetical protein